MAEIIPQAVTTTPSNVTIESPDINGVSGTTHNKIAEISTNSYVLQSAGMAGISDRTGVPTWLSNAIDAAVSDGTVSIETLINDLTIAVDVLDTGVSQQITSIQNANESTNQLLTTEVSRLDNDVAGVITLANTKVTPEQASATVAEFLEAEFNTPTVIANSSLLNLINTTSTAVETTATDITNLQSSFSQSNTDLQINIDANADIVATRFTNAGIGADGLLTAGASAGQSVAASVGNIKVSVDTAEGVTIGTHIYDATVDTLTVGMKRYINPALVPPFVDGNLEIYMGPIRGWVPVGAVEVVSDVLSQNTSDAADELLTEITTIKTQIDGVQETVTGTSTVSLGTGAPDPLVDPYKTWLSADNANGDLLERYKHTGDTYIQYHLDAKGIKVYDTSWRFAKGAVASNTDAAGFRWVELTDKTAIDIMSTALQARDLVDGKRRVFVDTPFVPYDIGDLWAETYNTSDRRIRKAKVNKLSTQSYSILDWEIIATDDTYAQAAVAGLDTRVVATELAAVNLDNAITAEEAARVQAILDEQTARAVDIAARVTKEALLDGRIDSEEAARIGAIDSVTLAYKEYSRIVALAMADGVLTPAEIAVIADAQLAVDAAKARFVAIESDLTNINLELSTIDTTLVANALTVANLDSAITAEEAARVQAVLDEQTARAVAIAARVAEDAALDDKITAEESSRVAAVNSVTAAYKEYSRIVTLAMADGTLTSDELDVIASSQLAIDAAKLRFANIEADVSNTFTQLSAIDTTLAANALEVAALDGRITTEEAALVTAISSEQAARASDIAERVAAEAALDGLITDEESARIGAINSVTTAYKEYSRIVALAMADGVLTTEELATIAEAQLAVDAAKARFAAIETDLSNVSLQLGTIDDTLTANALTVANLDGRITADEAALVTAISDEQSARAADIAARVIAEGLIDDRVTAEEAARASAITDVSDSYKEYGRIIAKAMADEVLTVDEQLAISSASVEIDLAKARFTAIEDFNSLLDLSVSQLELDKITLDTAISNETAARIADILTTTNAQLAEITDRENADALLDGRVTAEESARIQASIDLQAAYKEYSRVVTLALSDGVLTQDEANLIAGAQAAVDAAKQRFADLELITSVTTSVLKKYEVASGLIAAGFADGDITIFTSIEEPTTAEAFDLWRIDKAYIDIAEWEASDPETAYLNDEDYIYKYYDGFEWQFATANQVAMMRTTLNITSARDLADGKVRIFNVTPFVPYDIGDLWILDGEIFKSTVDQTVAFSSADWGVATKYTDDTVANTKTVTFKQNTPPTALAIGDMWIDTSDSNHPKIWDGTAWGTVRDGAIALVSATASDALAIANTALNASDGTITVYYETVDPELTNAIAIGDIWVDIDSDPEMAYRWRSNVETAGTFIVGLEYTILVPGTTDFTLIGAVDNLTDTVFTATGVGTGTGTASVVRWMPISDTGIAAALVAAQSAQTTADGKIVAHYEDGPTGPSLGAGDTGDLWYDTADGNKPYYWSGSVWVPIQDGAIAIAQTAAEVADGKAVIADGKAVVAQQAAANIVAGVDGFKIDLNQHLVGNSTLAEYVSGELDKEVVVYSGTNKATATLMKSGDIYIEITQETSANGIVVDVTNSYRYNGTDWVKINNNSSLTALADLADNKRTIFSGSTAPTSAVINDVWMTTAGVTGNDSNALPLVAEEMYIFGASGWYKATKYTDDQYAKDIESGIRHINLAQHTGWTTVTTIEAGLAQELVDRAASVTLVQGNVDAETSARVAAVLAEENARIAAINTEIADRDLAVSTAATQLAIDYKRYSDLIAEYMADGTLTAGELEEIAVAKVQIDITKARLTSIETTAALLDTTVATAEAAIAGITDVGGEIDQAKAAVTAAYEAYTEAYDSAVVNGVIDAAEAAAIASAAASLSAAEVALQASIDANYASLKTQIDGKITTHFLSGVPTLLNLPASGWSTTTLKDENLGDMYYDTDTSYAYRFKVATGVYSWERVQDSTIVDALTAASTAQGTADSKINSSIGTTAQRGIEQTSLLALDDPTTATGDLWIDTDENNAMYRFNGTAFVLVRDTASDLALTDFIDATYSVELGNLQAQVDGHAVTYFTETDPLSTGATVENNGDKWYKPSTNAAWTYLHEYTDKDSVVHASAWIAITNSKVINALEQASITEAAADRSIKSFIGRTDPVNYWVGDTWMDDRTGNIYVCTVANSVFLLSDWTLVSTYSDDTYALGIVAGTNKVDLSDHINDLGWTSDATVDTFITGTYATDKLATRAQIDGKSTSYFQVAEPFAIDDVNADIYDGDTWYNTATFELHVFRYVDALPLIDTANEWVLITDPYIQGAYDDAAEAKASADGKIQNFTAEPTHPYFVGDTWMQGVGGDIYVCNTDSTTVFSQTHWTKASKYTDDSKFNGYLIDGNQLDLSQAAITVDVNGVPTTTTFQETLTAQIFDNAIAVYSGNQADFEAQTTCAVGDLFIKTIVDNTASVPVTITYTYRCDAVNTWTEISNNANIIALADLTDGKRTVFGDAPVTPVTTENVPQGLENDLWLPSGDGFDGAVPAQLVYKANELYIRKSGVWTLATTFGNDINQAKDDLINIAKHDGAFNAARAEGSFIIYTTAPAVPEPYDILVFPLSSLDIADYDATSSDTVMLADTVYWDGIAPTDATSVSFKFWNPDTEEWVLCTPLMINAIKLISQSLAATAFTDSKARIFNVTPFPPYEAGDLWVQGADGDIVHCVTGRTSDEVYRSTDWEVSSKYPALIASTAAETKEYADTITATLEANVGTLIDGKSVSYFLPTEPFPADGLSPERDGDMWFIDGTNELYVYIDSTPEWKLIEDPKAIKAFNDAAKAQDTADHKRITFRQPTIPDDITTINGNIVPLEDGDMWIPTGAPTIPGTDPVEYYIEGEVYVFTSNATPVWQVATKYTQDISDLEARVATNLSNAVGDLTAQIDKEISTWFYNYAPTSSNAPWSKWIVDDLANGNTNIQTAHIGDILYNAIGDAGYRFIGSDGVFDWLGIDDIGTLDALAAAYAAKSSSDSKIRHHIGTAGVLDVDDNDMADLEATLVESDHGDLFTATDDKNALLKFNYYAVPPAFELIRDTKDTEDLSAYTDAVAPKINVITAQMDNKVEYFFTLSTALVDPKDVWTTEVLKAAHHNDVKYYTDTEQAFRYVSGKDHWELDTGTIAKTLKAISLSDAAINNGKMSVFTSLSTEPPVTDDIGDLWVESDTGRVNVWTGALWEQRLTSDEEAAKDAMEAASRAVGTANQLISDIANDSKFEESEKIDVRGIWSKIVAEYEVIWRQAEAYLVSTSNYYSAYFELSTYITPMLATSTTNDIDRTVFTGHFNLYYAEKLALLNTLANVTKTIADNAKLQADHDVRVFRDTLAHIEALFGDIADAVLNDLAIVSDELYYSESTGIATTNTNVNGFGKLTLKFNGVSWAAIPREDLAKLANVTWAGGASSVVANPVTGALTGWDYSDGSVGGSEFTIAAESFYIENSTIPGYKPFSVDGTNVTFNGKVTFSNVTGTEGIALTNELPGSFNIKRGYRSFTTVDSGYSYISKTDSVGTVSDSSFPIAYGEVVVTASPGLVLDYSSTQFTGSSSNYMFLCYNTTLNTFAHFFIRKDAIYPAGAYTKLSTATSSTTYLDSDISAGVLDNFIVIAISKYSPGTYTRLSTVKPVEVIRLLDVRDRLTELIAEGLSVAADKNLSNVTTIDGGKITTGKIQSANTNTYFDLANNQIKMNNGTFILDSTAAGTSVAPNIQGGYIKGGTVNGATITGGSIASDTTMTADSITAGTLTADVITSGSLTSTTFSSETGYLSNPAYQLLFTIPISNVGGQATQVILQVTATDGGYFKLNGTGINTIQGVSVEGSQSILGIVAPTVTSLNVYGKVSNDPITWNIDVAVTKFKK